MSKPKKKRPATRPRPYRWLFLLPFLILGLALAYYVIGQRNAPPALPENYAVGPVTDCVRLPAFIPELGLNNPAIDTSQRLEMGLVMRELGGGRYYQHPTWTAAGNIGPYAFDKDGYIYIVPVPLVSLQLNPTAEQNKIYRVDRETAEMSEYLALPWPLPPSGANPYGAVGLTYDCDTHSLYVSTVAGSTATEQVGGIYQVDLATGLIRSQLTGVDVLGVGVFNHPEGKRLYFGSARTPDLLVVPLDARTGELGDTAEPVLSLAAQVGGSFDNAQRIQFNRQGEMLVKGVAFNYSLQVASDPQRNVYTFRYDAPTSAWQLINIAPDELQ